MPNKTEQLQIRVTPEQKAQLKAQARRAGQGVSEYVLGKLLSESSAVLQKKINAVGRDAERRFALAAIHDWLVASNGLTLQSIGDQVVPDGLPPLWQNYLAAMFEQAAMQKAVTPPAWTQRVPALDLPYFATTLTSLRPYLMRVSPVPFKRRNLFIDSGIGSRV